MKREELAAEQRRMRLRHGRTGILTELPSESAGRGLVYAERRIREFFSSAGCTVLKNGWPDFFVKKGDKYLLIEAKGRHEKASNAQVEMHKMLKSIGLKVMVVRPEVDSLYQILKHLE